MSLKTTKKTHISKTDLGMQKCKSMKLSESKNGICRIQKISGNAKLKLMRMGISEGDNIEVLYKIRNGPVIIKVFSTEIAIGKGMAEEIEVEQINSKVNSERNFAFNSFSNFKENFKTFAKGSTNGILKLMIAKAQSLF